MRPLEDLLVELAASVSPQFGDARGHVQVTDAEVSLPIETGNGGGLLTASLPRGRLITGFASATSQMRVVFGALESGPGESLSWR